jgi:predicted TIM-barrel fold metal-dependent hydrolase
MSGVGSLREAFFRDGRVPDCPIVDMHGHWGEFYGAYLPAADPEVGFSLLDRAGVRLVVICHHAALLSTHAGNAANIEAVRARPDRLRAYCGVNPNYPEVVNADLASYDDYADVYVGLKFLPAYHGIAVDDDRYTAAWEFANARKLPVLVHTWGNDPFNGYDQLRRSAERYPDVQLLLGHSLHSRWDQAVIMANEFPNVYLELTAIPDERGVLELMIEQVGSRKMVFGTDFPWFSHHYYIGAILAAPMTDEDRRNIFYRNARRILGLGVEC